MALPARGFEPRMKIKVLFFGLTHDLTGFAQEQVELPEGESLDALWRRYETRFPRLAPFADSLLVAVNQEIAKRETLLREGATALWRDSSRRIRGEPYEGRL